MYLKDLTEDFRLRLTKVDMDFLKKLSNERQVTVSEVVRSIIGEYRRSLDYMKTLNGLVKMSQEKNFENVAEYVEKEVNRLEMSHGDTETTVHNKL